MYVHAGLCSHIYLHFIGAGVCACDCICPHIFGCVVHFCILKVRTCVCLCVRRCGWMLILQQASVTEQSSARGSNRSCWVRAIRLMKITAPVICIVTNIQFGWSEATGGITHWHWLITTHQVKLLLQSAVSVIHLSLSQGIVIQEVRPLRTLISN